MSTSRQPQLDPAVLAAALLDAADAAGVGVAITEVSGSDATILLANEVTASLLGRSVDALTGTSVAQFDGTGGGPTLSQQVRGAAASAEKCEPVPAVVRHADGFETGIDVSTRATEVEGRRIAVSFVAEGTREARDALRHSEERFRALVEALAEPVFITGAQGLVYGNPAAVRFFGYDSLDEVLGEDARAFAHPEDVPALEQRALAMLAEGRALTPFEYRVKKRDGSIVTIEVSSIPIEYEGSRAILTFARDATGRKRREAQLLQVERSEVLGLLAGGFAHAINNPLTYVLLDLREVDNAWARLATEPSEREAVLGRLREAREGAQRIARIVERLRVLSRVEDDRLGAVDLTRVLTGVLDLLGNEILHRGRLTTEVEDPPFVLASRGRVEQLFLDLLVHVVQAFPMNGRGRATLRIGRSGQDATVELDHDLQQDHPGVPRATASSQARSAEALSLARCRGVVEGLGGEMHVSLADQALSVRIRLVGAGPLTTRPPGVPSSVPRELDRTRPARILVVDGDAAVGTALKLMLEPEHRVITRFQAATALELLGDDEDFDVIFCDLGMPARGALELQRAVAQRNPGLARRFVFMTGGAPSIDEAALLKGSDAPRVEKPFDLPEVRTLVLRLAHERSNRS